MPTSFLVLLSLGILLEGLSLAFRSLSLGFRLFANVSAGHVLSDIAGTLRFTSAALDFALILQFCYLFALASYESFVSLVQIGVYTALISVYAI